MFGSDSPQARVYVCLCELETMMHEKSSNPRSSSNCSSPLLVSNSGQGRETYSDGTWYEGGFHNNLRNLKGKVVMPSGEIFVGDWRNGRR